MGLTSAWTEKIFNILMIITKAEVSGIEDVSDWDSVVSRQEFLIYLIYHKLYDLQMQIEIPDPKTGKHRLQPVDQLRLFTNQPLTFAGHVAGIFLLGNGPPHDAATPERTASWPNRKVCK